jgi:glycosyltransferase involved in cell wall biosynthesis
MTAIPAMADVPTLELLSATDLRVKNPIRVLHVLEATLGGTLRYMENIAAATEGTQIVFGLAYGSARADSRLQPLLERARAIGWLTYPIDMRREIGPRNDFSAFVKLRQAIGRFKPHILHCHSSKAGALGRAAASLQLRVPVRLFTPHALAVPLGSKYLKIEKMLARYTDGFIAVSESERAEIIDFSLADQSSVDVVYPSIDSEYFKPSSRSHARQSLGFGHGPLILGVGRLTAQKDPASFLAIIERLRARLPEVKAVWLGSGEGEADFRERVAVAGLQGVVRLVPWQHDIRGYIAAADVLLSTSMFESFGYMVAEALSMEVPVVATDVTGTSDIMRGGLRESLYPVRDYDRAVWLLSDLLKNSSKASEVGCLGRSEVKRRFTANLMRGALIRSYTKALESTRTRSRQLL